MKAILLEPTLLENRRVEPGEVDLPESFIKENPNLFKIIEKAKVKQTDYDKVKAVSSGEKK